MPEFKTGRVQEYCFTIDMDNPADLVYLQAMRQSVSKKNARNPTSDFKTRLAVRYRQPRIGKYANGGGVRVSQNPKSADVYSYMVPREPAKGICRHCGCYVYKENLPCCPTCGKA
jgi:hypothetical protein